MKNKKKRANGIKITRDIYFISWRIYFQKDTEESPENFMAPCLIFQDWHDKKYVNILLTVYRSDTIAEVWKCNFCKYRYL